MIYLIYISHIYIYHIYMVYDIYDIYIYILWYDIWYIYDYMLMITVYGRFLQCGYSTSCMVDSGKIRTQKWMRTGGIPLWLRKPPLVGRPINQLICFYTVWDRIGICLMSPGLSIGSVWYIIFLWWVRFMIYSPQLICLLWQFAMEKKQTFLQQVHHRTTGPFGLKFEYVWVIAMFWSGKWWYNHLMRTPICRQTHVIDQDGWRGTWAEVEWPFRTMGPVVLAPESIHSFSAKIWW